MSVVPFTTRPCVSCGHSTTLSLNAIGYERWRRGAFVQDAFPQMPPEQREMLISGTHPECWTKMFGEDDE
jgi:hypothetical protein